VKERMPKAYQRHRRRIAVVVACAATLAAACGGGGPHSGAAPAIAQASQLASQLDTANLPCVNPHNVSGFVGDKPLPQEQIDCAVLGHQVSLVRYQDFSEVDATLRSPRLKQICAFAPVFHVDSVAYLYGDNWIIESDPLYPDVTDAVMGALNAGKWILHC